MISKQDRDMLINTINRVNTLRSELVLVIMASERFEGFEEIIESSKLTVADLAIIKKKLEQKLFLFDNEKTTEGSNG